MSQSTASLISTARRLFLANLLIVSVYAGVVLLHNWMFWGDAPDAEIGILFDEGLMKQAGISCPGPVAVRMDAPIARYRCSTSGIVLGAFTLKRPIIPWPAYEDGESAELTGVIQATMANASR
ncbi:MAG TPA: hypothetical protein PKJ41_20370 [Bryobacteraceae bacterium]|nr:hypothetical protein [Bryobacteraceae bacterium]